MSTPTPDIVAAFDFLDHMFEASVPRHLVAINDAGMVAALSFDASTLEMARAWVEAHQGNSIYYSVNELNPGVLNRKATKRDVARALYLHVDVDDRAALSRICEFIPKPTTVVCSGGGYQAFWKLKEPTRDLNRVERINADLAKKLGGDKCHNVDRIMRLPGTVNVPNVRKRKIGRVPTLAYVVEDVTDWSRCYSLNEFGYSGVEEIDGATSLCATSSRSTSANCHRAFPRRRLTLSSSATIPRPRSARRARTFPRAVKRCGAHPANWRALAVPPTLSPAPSSTLRTVFRGRFLRSGDRTNMPFAKRSKPSASSA
jgi:RepB DNA-primase from phage plasmid